MARKVFFSFHYADIMRVTQVRNSWRIRAGGDNQPFFDKARWETLKRTNPQGITRWINEQLDGSSVTVVLVGENTAYRKWVKYEIDQSVRKGNGLLAIRIHNVRHPQLGTSRPGPHPFEQLNLTSTGLPLTHYYYTYDWVQHDGYNNFASWVEAAARRAGK
jgi:hypothetical protein